MHDQLLRGAEMVMSPMCCLAGEFAVHDCA